MWGGSVSLEEIEAGLRLSRENSSVGCMTQDELWLKKYQEVKAFIETNHRSPSRHNPEERFKYCNWLKHNKKLLNAGEMKEDRVALFKNLLEMGEKYRRKNQYE
jgi:hypothetical protein